MILKVPAIAKRRNIRFSNDITCFKTVTFSLGQHGETSVHEKNQQQKLGAKHSGACM